LYCRPTASAAAVDLTNLIFEQRNVEPLKMLIIKVNEPENAGEYHKTLNI
jgi:hypothetical protein